MPDGPSHQSRVVPNAGYVVGSLRRIVADPDGGSVWTIAVEETRDIGNHPNFAKDRAGAALDVYVGPGLKKAFHEGDRIQARVVYRGDERGGRFALVDDDVKKR